jgi:uncharacterized protein
MFEEITEAECRVLLEKNQIGRVSFTARGKQFVFPVNYAFNEDSIVFRIASDGVAANIPMTEVAFEIDDFDTDTKSGWSVLVQGHANDVTTTIDERSEHLRNLTVTPWIGNRPMWIAVHAQTITGRRLPAQSE